MEKKKSKKKFLILIATEPNINHENNTALKSTAEYQLIWGIKVQREDTITPKSIFGVADPRIINSGLPVYEPDNQC